MAAWVGAGWHLGLLLPVDGAGFMLLGRWLLPKGQLSLFVVCRSWNYVVNQGHQARKLQVMLLSSD